jgi:hypothetical protein
MYLGIYKGIAKKSSQRLNIVAHVVRFHGVNLACLQKAVDCNQIIPQVLVFHVFTSFDYWMTVFKSIMKNG